MEERRGEEGGRRELRIRGRREGTGTLQIPDILVIYCCVTNCLKTVWLKTMTSYCLSRFCGLTGLSWAALLSPLRQSQPVAAQPQLPGGSTGLDGQ